MLKNYICFLFIILMSCNYGQRRGTTPWEFLNKVIVNDSLYKKDSIAILVDLYAKMKSHKESFNHPEYFDSTLIIVDSIIYDSTLNKIAVFVVAQNPTYRNPHSDSKLPFYYHANCYLGKRNQNDSSLFDLHCLCRFSEINFDDKATVVKALKEDFFFELATVLDENSQPVFKYNIDDKRFWTSPAGWKRMFE